MLRSFSFICVLPFGERASNRVKVSFLPTYGYGILALLVGVMVKMAKAMAITLGRIRAKAR